MKDCFSTDSDTKELTCIFLKDYYERYDRLKVTSLLHPDIIWVDGNLQKKYETRQGVTEYLFQKEGKSISSCEIKEQFYHITCLSDVVSMVDGGAVIRKYGEDTGFSLNFSFIWKSCFGSFLLIHANVHAVEEEKAIYRICSQDKELFMYDSYQKALDNSGIIMLEYDVLTDQLLFFKKTIKTYGMPSVWANGVEALAGLNLVEEGSLPGFFGMFEKIRAGEAVANCYVREKSNCGQGRYFELSLTNFFGEDGKPVRAIGVRKEVSDILLLQKEKEYGKNLTADQVLIFEANICNDTLEFAEESWKNNLGEHVDCAGYYEVSRLIVEKFVSPEYQEIFKEKLSTEYIKQVYSQGENLISFEYRRKSMGDGYVWYRAIISIIKDNITDNLNIRFYHSNIHEEKIRLLDEQKLYETLKLRAEWIYEIDYSANRMLSGHENWSVELGIDVTDNYTYMISELARKAVHTEDRKAFLMVFNRQRIIKEYKEGKSQTVCHYRKIGSEGKCRWHNCLVQLYEEEQQGNIRGIAYVEDIDEQKREELTLKYNAEHDVTTGVLNKATTERKISKFLELPVEPGNCHAFIIIDIDYFKGVNDNFGHYIGDEVIKEVAERIRRLFREDDIVGRIGGDEFGVFMKCAKSRLVIEKKAKELCENLSCVYSVDNISCQVSASIGISICDKNGKTYEELYQQADGLLYEAKRNGRNQFQMEKRVTIHSDCSTRCFL